MKMYGGQEERFDANLTLTKGGFDIRKGETS
jgi:hypothetical protein